MIGPETWGPHGWKFIHYVTLGYPHKPTKEHKERYKAFFLLLKNVLPCSLCANHFSENLKKVPLTDDILDNKSKLVKWGIDIHNEVNEMKDKPRIDYKTAYNMINTNVPCKENIITITKNITNNFNTMYGLLGILIAIILIGIIYKKY